MGEFPVQFGKACLKKEEILQLKSDFDFVRQTGNVSPGRLMVLSSCDCPQQPMEQKFRFGLICGRKFSNRAVERNRAKRLLRESVRLMKAEIRPCHAVFIARAGIKLKSLQEVQKEMMYLVKKVGLWKTK